MRKGCSWFVVLFHRIALLPKSFCILLFPLERCLSVRLRCYHFCLVSRRTRLLVPLVNLPIRARRRPILVQRLPADARFDHVIIRRFGNLIAMLRLLTSRAIPVNLIRFGRSFKR